jgi:hypothetical protein
MQIGWRHTHENLHFLSIISLEEVRMEWGRSAEDTLAKVEQGTLLIARHIGLETKKERHPDHKHKVEISHTPVAGIEPGETLLHKVVKQGISMHASSGIVEEFSQEEGDSHLVAVKKNRRIGQGYLGLLDTSQLLARRALQMYIQNGHRLKILPAHLRRSGITDFPYGRDPSLLPRKEIDNEFVIVDFHRPEHYAVSLALHFMLQKYEK